MAKRIILACSILNYGGVGKIIGFVASSLRFSDYDITVLSLREENRPSFLPEEITFASLNTNKTCFWRLREIVELRRLLKSFLPLTICSFGSEPSVIVRIASIGLKKIKVVSAERSDPYSLPTVWKYLSSWAYRNSNYCVFQLEKQRDFYGERVKNKSFVIPNPYIPHIGSSAILEKKKTIVSAGRFVYQKGYDTLIRAFAIVVSKHPDYVLELYGGGEEKEKYETIIHELKIEGSVKLYNYNRDISSVIAGCSVFVLSSRFEGIPNVLIEAMSLGVPTVATDCTPGGPSFLTNCGENGLLVPVDDVNAMSLAICSIIDSPSLSSQLSKAGKKVCEKLDAKIISRKWKELFDLIMY